jgi:DHA2 family multidrug resistance protein
MGPTFGPTLGGYITDNLSWHWIFFVNIPVGIVASILAWTYVKNVPGAKKPKKIDWWGIIFLVVAVGSLQFVLEEGASKDWFQSREITVLSILSVLGLIAFIFRELKIDYPAVNIRLYKNYNLAMGSIMNLMLGMLLFGTVFIFPLFVQISLAWTPTLTGVFMIPSALCTAISMPIVGKMLGSGKNPKTIIIIGILITFCFLLMMSFSSPDSSKYDFYFPFVLRGVGLAFMMSPILSLAVAGLRGKDMAQAIGLANMIRQLGGAIGIALLNVFISNKNAEVRGDMLAYINDYASASTERMAAFTQTFIAKGYSQGDAEAVAYRLMESVLYKQSALVSYDQGFFVVGIAILFCIPIVLLIRYKKGERAKPIADH